MKFCRVSYATSSGPKPTAPPIRTDVQPIFRLLNTQDHELAIKTFKAHADFYVSTEFQAPVLPAWAVPAAATALGGRMENGEREGREASSGWVAGVWEARARTDKQSSPRDGHQPSLPGH